MSHDPFTTSRTPQPLSGPSRFHANSRPHAQSKPYARVTEHSLHNSVASPSRKELNINKFAVTDIKRAIKGDPDFAEPGVGRSKKPLRKSVAGGESLERRGSGRGGDDGRIVKTRVAQVTDQEAVASGLVRSGSESSGLTGWLSRGISKVFGFGSTPVKNQEQEDTQPRREDDEESFGGGMENEEDMDGQFEQEEYEATESQGLKRSRQASNLNAYGQGYSSPQKKLRQHSPPTQRYTTRDGSAALTGSRHKTSATHSQGNFSRPTPIQTGYNDPPASMLTRSHSTLAMGGNKAASVRGGSVIRGGSVVRGYASSEIGSPVGGGMKRSGTMMELNTPASGRRKNREAFVGQQRGLSASMSLSGGLAEQAVVEDEFGLVATSPFTLARSPALRNQSPRLQGPATPRSMMLRHPAPEYRESATPLPQNEMDLDDKAYADDVRSRHGRRVTPSVSLGLSRVGVRESVGPSQPPFKPSRLGANTFILQTQDEIEESRDLAAEESERILATLEQLSRRGASSATSRIPPSLSSRTLRKAIHVPMPSETTAANKRKAMLFASTSGLAGGLASQKKDEKDKPVVVGPCGTHGRKSLKVVEEPAEKESGLKDRDSKMDGVKSSSAQSTQAKAPVPVSLPDPAKFPLPPSSTAMKPLPIDLSPSLKNVRSTGVRSGGSTLRAKSAHTSRTHTPSAQVSSSRPSGRFSFLDADMDGEGDDFPGADDLEKAASAPKAPAPSAAPSSFFTAGAAKAATATAPPAKKVEETAPVQKPTEPAPLSVSTSPVMSPSKATRSGLRPPVDGHKPRASSPLAQAPPVTASPDSPLADKEPAHKPESLTPLGQPKTNGSTPSSNFFSVTAATPPSSSPATIPPKQKGLPDFFATSKKPVEDAGAASKATPNFSFGVTGASPLSSAPKVVNGLGLGKPSATPTPPASFGGFNGFSAPIAAAQPTATPAEPPKNPFGGGFAFNKPAAENAASDKPAVPTFGGFGNSTPASTSSFGQTAPAANGSSAAEKTSTPTSFAFTPPAKPEAAKTELAVVKPSPGNPLFGNGFGGAAANPATTSPFSTPATPPVLATPPVSAPAFGNSNGGAAGGFFPPKAVGGGFGAYQVSNGSTSANGPSTPQFVFGAPSSSNNPVPAFGGFGNNAGASASAAPSSSNPLFGGGMPSSTPGFGAAPAPFTGFGQTAPPAPPPTFGGFGQAPNTAAPAGGGGGFSFAVAAPAGTNPFSAIPQQPTGPSGHIRFGSEALSDAGGGSAGGTPPPGALGFNMGASDGGPPGPPGSARKMRGLPKRRGAK